MTNETGDDAHAASVGEKEPTPEDAGRRHRRRLAALVAVPAYAVVVGLGIASGQWRTLLAALLSPLLFLYPWVVALILTAWENWRSK